MADGIYYEENTCDLICIGFGPAALALAITFLDKKNAYIARGKVPPLSTITFIEKYPSFQWHPGMLLPGASMQISFLKDLATLRSPTSPYTFLSYLHEHDRLVTYINRSSFTPSRREYSDYLTWAANKVAQEPGVAIHYGEQATSINSDRATVSITSVSQDKNITRVRKGRHLVIAPGGVPRLPPSLSAIAAEATTRIIHTSVYAQRIDGIMGDILSRLHSRTPTITERNDCVSGPVRIAIIGGGQSAAEVFLDIQDRLRKLPPPSSLRPHSTVVNHSVDLIIRRGGLKPSDSSPFTNEIFDPGATDFFFDLSTKARIDVKREYENTNYGVVNPDTLTKIYEQIYDQKVEDGAYARGASSDAPNSRINILKYRTVVDATQNNPTSGSSFDDPSIQDKAIRPHDYMFTLTLQHVLGSDPLLETRPYDAIILATGYQRCSWIDMLDYKDFGEDFGLPKSSAKCDSGTLQGEERQQEHENLRSPARVPVTPPWTATESSSASESSPRSSRGSVSSPIQDRPPEPGETICVTISEGSLDEVQLDLGDAHLPVNDQLTLDPLPKAVGHTFPHEVVEGVVTPVGSQSDKVRISRAYRLLPVEENALVRDSSSPHKMFLPRVYVQGIAEETHGLSDTLLSVLSIRCGEVIDDLFQGVEAQIAGFDG